MEPFRWRRALFLGLVSYAASLAGLVFDTFVPVFLQAGHPLAAERLLDLAAPRGPCGAAPLSRHGAAAAVAHLRHPAPGRVPHTRPPHVTGHSTDPAWHAWLETRGMSRRSRYEGPTGMSTVVLEAATGRGLPSLTLRGQAPHYLGGATNPAVSRALLSAVAHLLDLELDVSPFEATVRAFRTQCDQAVAKDATVQTYVRQ